MILPDFLNETPDGEIRVAGHRIGLYHVIHYYNEGFGPEMLACQYPSVPLALIHKVIAWYLENSTEADVYLAACRAELTGQRDRNPRRLDLAGLRQRLEALRRAGDRAGGKRVSHGDPLLARRALSWPALARNPAAQPTRRTPAGRGSCGRHAELPLGSTDPEILLWAEREERVLITEDRQTMAGHLAEHLRTGHRSPGVFVVALGCSIAQMVAWLELVAHAGDPAEYENAVTYVP